MDKWQDNEEIKLFREYLRIPSVHPNVDYEPCIQFLIRQAQSLQLPYKIYHVGGNLKTPLFIASWIGTNPELPSILVNSHMDVVPVYEDKWTHPPFAADIDAEGKIFARGAQDCKCIGTQYFGAIRALKRSNTQIKRTLHVMFVPDEEIGGVYGMETFSKTQEFRDLNVGFALDEGSATDNDKFVAHYAERSIWQINFKFNGSAGHGSLLLKNTPGEKLINFLNNVATYRSSQVKLLQSNNKLKMGDVTSINLTMIKGGVQSNVVPTQLEACFDMRIAVDVDLKEFERLLQKWCTEAGGDIEWEWIFRCDTAPPTKIDQSNPYWCAIQKVFNEMNLILEAHVFTGGTDSQFLRNIGIPSIGFSPMNNTPTLMHDHDEYLKADVYLRGIEIYVNIFKELLNL
ncbi:aminoacylase-1-like [Lucilia sericata]|uniref:aminoacylase-1-like n=1 Tax=Lucilia sericata TaxID=13632 RepID=UPI0018A7EFF3|nr:aminoacylase-1-like [Lucilia sericata]